MAKRSKGKSPTARTMEVLREQGAICDKVEQTVPHTFIKRDLFGCIDILAIRGGAIIGIQATSHQHHAERLKKSLEEGRLKDWLAAGGKFEVWSWSESQTIGKRKRWHYRIDHIRISDNTKTPEPKLLEDSPAPEPKPKPPLSLF